MNFERYKEKVLKALKPSNFEMKPAFAWVNSRINFPYKIVKLLDEKITIVRTPKNTINKKGVDVPVKYIAQNAFSSNPNITDVIIDSDEIFEIREKVFANCTKLKTLCIPKSVKHIYHGAFKDCPNLKDVYYEGTEQEWNQINIATYKNIIKDKDNLGLFCKVEKEKTHGNESLLKAKKYFNCKL